MPATRTWLKNPLAIFTSNELDARGGLVVQDGVIVEVLAAGQQPSAPCNEVFEAREHVILPGLINLDFADVRAVMSEMGKAMMGTGEATGDDRALLAAQKQGNVEVRVNPGSGKEEDAPVVGRLSFIDNAVDPQAGTIRVKGEFANRDTSLWPGQYVTANVVVQTLKNAVVIPQTAIITATNGTFVYVLGEGNSARQVPVQRVYAFGDQAAVTGLQGDERVITEGKQNLRPGGKVRLAGQGAKPAAPAPAKQGEQA